MKHYLKFIIVLAICLGTNVFADTTYIRGQITKGTSKVTVRTCASSSCGAVKSDTNSNIAISYPEMFEVLGEENGFYKISLQFNSYYYTGYISKGTSSKAYVETKTFKVTDGDINQMLNLGFPKSYAEKLAKLKVSHPNWQFVPYKVNATWDEVIAGETKYISTNLINGSNTSLRNTEDGAYVNGKWTEFAGGGWYSASKQTVKYFVDPRNFLNDGHVFMFEVLNFDSSVQTTELLQSLLNGTFMSGNAFYYNDKNEKVNISYAQTFRDAGEKNQISSVHLISRVIQEQGSNGSSLSSGDNSEYPGYYNFFNINANGKTTSEVIHNGLAYAKKKGWNSPYKAIIGGASLLNDYIKYGQNTLYLQKFDFAGDTYYSTQYMQNVRAPYSESYTAYSAYVKNNSLDIKFTFSVPVFKGTMPDKTSLDIKYNEDSSLSKLSVTSCNLNPSFTSSAYNYTCYVDKKIDNITVNASPTASTSTVKGTGKFDLNKDVTVLEIIVTSAAGTTSTYKITVNKVDEVVLTPDEILAKMQISNKGGYISGFDLGSDANSFNKLLNSVYPKAVSQISENKVLYTGMNIKITSGITSNYTVVIYGDNNGDGVIDILDLLKIQKHLLGVNKLKNAYLYASDINKDGNVDIIDLLKIQKHILNVSKIEQ
ncbi:MAG: dockerin type I domain-containing protein [Bacilli bacterium]|nr:dockerin type I domain-containing protein [Bacilli bacterium]